jgi:hypothetical protein
VKRLSPLDLLYLKKEDMNKVAFLVPPIPVMNYRWSDLLALKRVALILLLICNLAFIVALSIGAYLAFGVFIVDPHHHLSFGNYGLIPGIIFTIIAIKLLVNFLKLSICLMRVKISK